MAAFAAIVSLLPRGDLPCRFLGLVLLLALIVFSAWRVLRRCDPVQLRLDADGALSLSFDDEKALRQATLLPGSVAFRYWLVLRLCIENEARVRHLVLLPDQMNTRQFRQLVTCLRWLVDSKVPDER